MARAKGSVNTRPVRKTTPRSFSETSWSHVTPGADMVARRPKRIGARSDEQLATDEAVKGMHALWVEQGRPDKWENMPGLSITCPADHVPDWMAQLRSSASFLNVKIRTTVRVLDDDSRELTFVALDKSVKDE